MGATTMSDYLARSITDQTNIIGLACVTTDLVAEAARLHGTSPTPAAALGRALVALGKDELQKLMKEQEQTEVTCEYCRSNYHFTREDLEALAPQT
jgi:redox-regulated HSP33 family molecular chaperone